MNKLRYHKMVSTNMHVLLIGWALPLNGEWTRIVRWDLIDFDYVVIQLSMWCDVMCCCVVNSSHQSVYLISSQNESREPVVCRMLDCDTITQAKEKALDAIYMNTPFSKRPSVHDLDLGKWSYSLHSVLGMTLNCIHIFIVTGSLLYWCVMRPTSQRFFIGPTQLYLSTDLDHILFSNVSWH